MAYRFALWALSALSPFPARPPLHGPRPRGSHKRGRPVGNHLGQRGDLYTVDGQIDVGTAGCGYYDFYSGHRVGRQPDLFRHGDHRRPDLHGQLWRDAIQHIRRRRRHLLCRNQSDRPSSHLAD